MIPLAAQSPLDWLAHVVVSALVHAVIYGAAWRVMRGLTAGEAVGLAALVVVGCVVWASRRA